VWRITQEGGLPPALTRAAVSYDGSRKQWLMFDGFSVPRETWQSDGLRWLPYDGRAPDARIVAPVSVYDHARKNHVLFGGATSTNETWTWNG
jgi:phage terminase large subunit-like protein